MYHILNDYEWVEMDPSGFEPEASALQGRCSTAELRAREYISSPIKMNKKSVVC